MYPTNVGGHLELKYVENKYDNEGESNPYLQNMNPNFRIPYCKPFGLIKNLITLVTL
jgi:hypothetical protein